MQTFESEIGIRCRSQSVHSELNSNFSKKLIQKWMTALPRANIGQMSKQIYSKLVEANKSKIPFKNRLLFIQVLVDEIESLLESLEKHYKKAGVSLNAKQKKIAELNRAILNEEAYAYKAIIHEIISEQNTPKNQEILGEALVLCCYYLARMIGFCYQFYMEPPARLWKELHIIFQLAQKHHLDTFEHTIPKPKTRVSLRTLYKSALLLSLSHPNELRVNDFWPIQFESLDYARKIKLTKHLNDEIEYVVNTNSKAAPFHRSLIAKESDDHYLGIDVQPLIFHLESLLADNNHKRKKFNAILTQHLISALGNMAKRSFSRTPCNERIKVAIGLSSTHALIERGEEEFETSKIEQKPIVIEDALSRLEGSLRDVKVLDIEDSMQQHPVQPRVSKLKKEEEDKWVKMYRPKVSVNESGELQDKYHLIPVDMKGKALPRNYRLMPASILNISPGGYCLKLEDEMPKRTQTDEVIGLMEIDEQGIRSWNIGIIRWLQRSNSNDLSAGVQLISPNARSVSTRIKTDTHQEISAHRSLLLPSLDHIGQPASLLTPTIPYKVGSVVRMNDEEIRTDIKLEEKLQSGRSYSRFTFTELSDTSAEEEVRLNSVDDETDFSTVWEIL